MTIFLRLTIFCALLMLLGCQKTPPPPPMHPNVEKLSAFNSVYIDGPYNIFFAEDATGYRISAVGDQGVIDHSTVHIEEHTLVLQLDPTYTQPKTPVTVTIYAPSLTNMIIAHANEVNLEKLSLPNFELRAKTGNVTVLNQFGDKASYTLSGNAHFRGNCINTDRLTVQAYGHAEVQLQCINTNNLILTGAGASHFDIKAQARGMNLTLGGHSTLNSAGITAGKFTINTKQQAQINLNKANVGLLSLTANDHTQTTLQGAVATLSAHLSNHAELFINHAHIKRLQTFSANSSVIEFTNLKTNHYSLTQSGDSYLRLTGKAQRLDASLSNLAKLDSICLKSNTLFVRTFDKAEARVRNYHGLSAVASQESTIYYYQDPKMVAEYLQTSGSVIRMQGIVKPRC